MENVSEVESLFSKKASNWNEKYSPSGPLRSRLYAFEERLNELVSAPARVLDFGCGTGNLACYLAGRGYAVTACDIVGKMIERAQGENLGTPVDWFVLPARWQELPFASHAFDAVLASSVFEYVPDVNRVFDECHRTLKPGGFLIATIPNPQNLVRKAEKIFRPIVTAMSMAPFLKRIPKIEPYAAYLRCSRNRMPLDEWFAIANQARFTTIEEGKSRASKAALAFIVFRKKDDKA